MVKIGFGLGMKIITVGKSTVKMLGTVFKWQLTVGYLRSCHCRYFKLSTNVDGQFCKYLVSGSLLTELKFKIWEQK